jgi:hypothetical protein
MDLEEAVARAICDAYYCEGTWDATMPMALSGPQYRERFTKLARAAIKAVGSYRVPSPPTGPDQRPGIGQDREQG